MKKTDYHNHTSLCRHARGMPWDYVKRAVELGYEEIGISDHGPLLDDFFIRMTMKEYEEVYLPALEKALAEFKDQIKIYRGLEIEYLPNQVRHYEKLLEDLDYLILGQHFLISHGKLIDVYGSLDEDHLDAYGESVDQALESGYFRILAHPDIFLFNNQHWNEKTETVARRIIETAVRTETFLEINANGFRRKKILNQDGEAVLPYPRKEFWNLVREYPGAKILIGEDNHSPEYMGDRAVRHALRFAEELNLKVRERLFDV